MSARLEEAGVSVERAAGLDSGLEALSGPEKPDVVIVDCALGPEATNRARPSRARGGRPAEPRAVFAIRKAGLRADRAQGFRRLAGQAGPHALAL